MNGRIVSGHSYCCVAFIQLMRLSSACLFPRLRKDGGDPYSDYLSADSTPCASASGKYAISIVE